MSSEKLFELNGDLEVLAEAVQMARGAVTAAPAGAQSPSKDRLPPDAFQTQKARQQSDPETGYGVLYTIAGQRA